MFLQAINTIRIAVEHWCAGGHSVIQLAWTVSAREGCCVVLHKNETRTDREEKFFSDLSFSTKNAASAGSRLSGIQPMRSKMN
jgi:hypothetical protein